MAYKFCPECGFKLNGEYKFCPECGFNLIEDQSSEYVESTGKNIDFFDEQERIDGEELDLGALEDALSMQIEKKNKDEEEYKTVMDKAELYCIRGKFEQAKAIYKKILKNNPKDLLANVGVLRTLTDNLTTFYDYDAELHLEYLHKVFDKEQLIREVPEMKEFYKMRSEYIIRIFSEGQKRYEAMLREKKEKN